MGLKIWDDFLLEILLPLSEKWQSSPKFKFEFDHVLLKDLIEMVNNVVKMSKWVYTKNNEITWTKEIYNNRMIPKNLPESRETSWDTTKILIKLL